MEGFSVFGPGVGVFGFRFSVSGFEIWVWVSGFEFERWVTGVEFRLYWRLVPPQSHSARLGV